MVCCCARGSVSRPSFVSWLRRRRRRHLFFPSIPKAPRSLEPIRPARGLHIVRRGPHKFREVITLGRRGRHARAIVALWRPDQSAIFAIRRVTPKHFVNDGGGLAGSNHRLRFRTRRAGRRPANQCRRRPRRADARHAQRGGDHAARSGTVTAKLWRVPVRGSQSWLHARPRLCLFPTLQSKAARRVTDGRLQGIRLARAVCAEAQRAPNEARLPGDARWKRRRRSRSAHQS